MIESIKIACVLVAWIFVIIAAAAADIFVAFKLDDLSKYLFCSIISVIAVVSFFYTILLQISSISICGKTVIYIGFIQIFQLTIESTHFTNFKNKKLGDYLFAKSEYKVN